MLSSLNRDSNVAEKYPDLFRAYDAKISEFNATMASEAKVVVPLLVGAWFVLLFIAFRAERFDPAFRTAGVFLILASIGYAWSRGYRCRNEENSIAGSLAFDIANREDQRNDDSKAPLTPTRKTESKPGNEMPAEFEGPGSDTPVIGFEDSERAPAKPNPELVRRIEIARETQFQQEEIWILHDPIEDDALFAQVIKAAEARAEAESPQAGLGRCIRRCFCHSGGFYTAS